MKTLIALIMVRDQVAGGSGLAALFFKDTGSIAESLTSDVSQPILPIGCLRRQI